MNQDLNDGNLINKGFLIRVEELQKNSKINPYLNHVPILQLLKTPKNFWFSSVFRGYKIGTLAGNELISGPHFY